jgi:RNA polymerase sigma factor (TIGR02999 family)
MVMSKVFVDLDLTQAYAPRCTPQDSFTCSGGCSMTSSQHSLTRLLQDWSNGDKGALDKLLPIVYEELRRRAARYLQRERPDHTLQPTALINEAYLRLIDQTNVRWQNRAHFFAIAASLMRRILVDHARKGHAAKRGGHDVKLQVEEALVASKERDVNLVVLDEALTRFAEIDQRKTQVVELKFFSGLTTEETAEVLGVSPATVRHDWSLAKAWLRREIERGNSP